MRSAVLNALTVALLSAISSHYGYAGAFSLYTEGSAVEIGNFAAGSAAEAPDASIAWFNPAGLVLLKEQQMVFSGVGVFPSTKISGTSTFTTAFVPPIAPYVQTFESMEGARNALVPALHYAKPLGERAVFGFSVLSPFGLSTDWSGTSPVRYAGTLSSLTTVNVAPSLGGRLSDHFSVGLGLDLQWSWVKFNSEIGSPAFYQFSLPDLPSAPYFVDSMSQNSGDSFAVGFHAGALGVFNEEHTRVGVNYQSATQHRYQGYSVMTGRLADPFAEDAQATFRSDALYSDPITLPAIWTLSAYQDVNPTFALLGSIVYTQWQSFERIGLHNIAAFNDDPEVVGPALVSAITNQNYRNAWRAALGANYHVNSRWMLRVGGGYDQTPTIDAERDTRLPDGDRWALSAGSHFQVYSNIGVDVGYTYLFGIGEPSINKTLPQGLTSTYNVHATAKNHAQLVGLQAVWMMDDPTISMK